MGAGKPDYTIRDNFLVCRWRFNCRQHTPEFPLHEAVWVSINDMAADLLAGQIEDIEQAIEIDLTAGTARDVTHEVYDGAAELTFRREDEPSDELADEFDRRRIDYYGRSRREQEYARGKAIDERIRNRLDARAGL